MKKVGRVLKKSLIGIPVGVSLLMCAYFCIYLMVGGEVFANEISQLEDIKVFVSQILTSALLYYLVFVWANVFIDRMEDKERYDSYSFQIQNVLLVILFIVVCLGGLTAIDYANIIFSENIANESGLVLTMVLIIGVIYFIIKTERENRIVNKINESLKSRK